MAMADDHRAPFEGPEKLLEIWFAPSATDVPDVTEPSMDGRTGLRKVDRKIWEEMLEIVKCQVLSVIEGTEMDAYLLSESSLFVAPHRLILKTCGTTLNLLGLPRILEIAATEANLPSVHRCFYSRKSFMFPERQLEPHRDWKHEVQYLDNIFKDGAAYTVGKVNGDHWLLYLTTPEGNHSHVATPAPSNSMGDDLLPDFTIEILMSGLATEARQHFFSSLSPSDDPHDHASVLSDTLGISEIFSPHLTTLDAYSFQPCGYSSNALIKWGTDTPQKSASNFQGNATNGTSGSPEAFREGYYTIHVTPEEGWSYASFECNVPSHSSRSTRTVPDLKSLIQRVVAIFQPARLTLTLFISSRDNEGEEGESIEAVQSAFKLALTEADFSCGYPCVDSDDIQRSVNGNPKRLYKRTDKINYEFGGYEFAFASFELKS